MNLISSRFVLFIVLTATVYFLFPVKKYQWTILLAASYVFYAFSDLRYFAFILFTTLTSYAAACTMERMRAASKQTLAENKQIWDKEQKKRAKHETIENCFMRRYESVYKKGGPYYERIS